ncbi:hypothetical protein, partial [Enterococcus sp.]|uniref:DUF7278 family profilin-like fold-containing protein n=1 Tax=Enterococcus sp. TaxID=35783 RepID=UPI0028A1E48B
ADERGYDVDFFEALQWNNWKKLPLEVKNQLIQQILMYFVSPLKEITDLHLVEYAYAGIKCTTFQLMIDDEAFVFVPGTSEAILGWDLGVQGLTLSSWGQSWQTANTHAAGLAQTYGFQNEQDWSDYVNESTSPLRKAEIAPMLVQCYALPVGSTFVGILNTVTAEFRGHVERYNLFADDLQATFHRPTSFEESLRYALPQGIVKENHYYAALHPLTDDYMLFDHQAVSQTMLQTRLAAEGFSLLSEDQWEYCCGAGTRRLFRWGNEKSCEDGMTLPAYELLEPNMFGCMYGLADGWELTDGLSLKMDKLTACGHSLLDALPYATYYRSRQILQPEKVLSPQDYRYRKAILIEKDRI